MQSVEQTEQLCEALTHVDAPAQASRIIFQYANELMASVWLDPDKFTFIHAFNKKQFARDCFKDSFPEYANLPWKIEHVMFFNKTTAWVAVRKS